MQKQEDNNAPLNTDRGSGTFANTGNSGAPIRQREAGFIPPTCKLSGIDGTKISVRAAVVACLLANNYPKQAAEFEKRVGEEAIDVTKVMSIAKKFVRVK